jgi:hypothetical protein
VAVSLALFPVIRAFLLALIAAIGSADGITRHLVGDRRRGNRLARL